MRLKIIDLYVFVFITTSMYFITAYIGWSFIPTEEHRAVQIIITFILLVMYSINEHERRK